LPPGLVKTEPSIQDTCKPGAWPSLGRFGERLPRPAARRGSRCRHQHLPHRQKRPGIPPSGPRPRYGFPIEIIAGREERA